MLALLVGNIISINVCLVITKYLNAKKEDWKFTVFENLFLWFFHNYIYKEKFFLTSGKLFMINKEFRNIVIINGIKITKTFLFWSYFINLIESLTILFVLVCLQLQIVESLKAIFLNKKYFKLNDFIILLILFKFYIKILFLYSQTDYYIFFSIIIKTIYAASLLFVLLTYLLTFMLLSIIHFDLINLIKKNIKHFSLFSFCSLKISLIFITFFFVFFSFSLKVNSEIFESNNFFMELTIYFSLLINT